MGRYVIQTDVTKAIKKSLKKWGEIPIQSEYLDGVIRIYNYRKYGHIEEVDVVFKGKIYVKVYRESRNWYTTELLKTHNISKIKLNRFLRKGSLVDVQRRMNYFGVNIRDYFNISKIKWE